MLPIFLVVAAIGSYAAEIIACGADLNEQGNYFLTGNISGIDCLLINQSNVLINCNFHEIAGFGNGSAISINNVNNVKIQNCIITNFDAAISAKNSSLIVLEANLIRNNSVGILSNSSFGFITSSNSFRDNKNFSIKNTASLSINMSNNFFGTTDISAVNSTIFGNVDFMPLLSQDPYSDSDTDGIVNVADNCANDYNPDQLDKDSDGKGDACDIDLFIRGFAFDPLNEPSGIVQSLLTSQENGYFVIQYQDGYKDIIAGNITSLGGEILGSIIQNAFFVRINASKSTISSLQGVRFADVWQPAYRLSEELYNKISKGEFNSTEQVQLDVGVFRNIDDVMSQINSMGASVQHLYSQGDVLFDKFLFVVIPKNKVADISKIADIEDIDFHFVPQLELSQSSIIIGLRNNPADQNVLGLTGKGQILAEMDSGIDTGNLATLTLDLRGRVTIDPAITNGWADNDSGHGTHVLGISIGDGSSRPAGNIRGVAPKANLFFNRVLGDPTDTRSLTTTWTSAYNNGARVHGNSWGGGVLNGYGASSVEIDNFALRHLDFLFVKSSGNSGPNAATITQPGVSKNILTVGNSETNRALPNPGAGGPFAGKTAVIANTTFGLANGHQMAFPSGYKPTQSDSDNDIANSSSRGLTNDNRIKPDIVAPGSWILSLRSQVCETDLSNPANNRADINADLLLDRNDCVGNALPGGPISGYAAGYVVVDIQRTDTGAIIQNNVGVRNTPGDFVSMQNDFAAFFALAPAIVRVTNIRPIPANPNAPGDPLDAPFYMYLTGTSMAQPHASGTALLVREYLNTFRKQLNSSAMLVKAFIINGVTDMPATGHPGGTTGAIPNGLEGWGRLNVTNSVNPAKVWTRAQFADPVMTLAQSQDYNITNVRFSKDYPIAITLTWFDPIDAASTGRLVNDLDLKLISPSNKIYYGGANSFLGGQTQQYAPPAITKDNVNNVEKIFIRVPEDGFYNISVIAANLVTPPQNRFAVVYSQVAGADSADSTGNYRYNFTLNEDVYAKAVGLPNDTFVSVYVISDDGFKFDVRKDLTGLDKTERVSLEIKTDSLGTLNTRIWQTSVTSQKILQDFAANKGRYHIVIDIDGDHWFTPGVDIVDYHLNPGFEIKCGNDDNGHTCAIIDSSDSTGTKKDFFDKADNAYSKLLAISMDSNRQTKLYAVKSGSLIDGKPLVDDTGGPETVNLVKGVLKNTIPSIWNPELKGGDYELVLDVDANGNYNSSIDFKDPDGFSVISKVEEVRFAIDSNNVVHAVGIQHGATNLLLYGSSKKDYKVDKKHPEFYSYSTDNEMHWKVLRESKRAFYDSPDIAVDGSGNPYIITESHIGEFNWLLFLALNGTSGKLNYNFDKDPVTGRGDPIDVIFYYWDDFWAPSLTNPRIDVDSRTDMPVISSKVFLMFPDTFYFTAIYPGLFTRINTIITALPLVPFFPILGLVSAGPVYFGDSLQVATFNYKDGEGTQKWPFVWDVIDPVTGKASTSGRSFGIALLDQAEVLRDVATSSPRRSHWNWQVVDEFHGLNSFIGNGDMAVDKNGDIHVAYYRYENRDLGSSSPVKLYYSRMQNILDNSTGTPHTEVSLYTRPIKVSAKTAYNLFFKPAIDVDSDTKAHITWQSTDKIKYARIDSTIAATAVPHGDGGLLHFENLITVNDILEKDAASLNDVNVNAKPDIVVNAKGMPTILYRDTGSSNLKTLYLITDNATIPTIEFSNPSEIIKTSDYSTDPFINDNTIEINRRSDTFFEEQYIGFTDMVDNEQNMKYKKQMPHTTFLIVIDGLDSKRFKKELDAGNLPNLDSLLHEFHSLRANLQTSFPQGTFPTYTSIMTGLYPKNHYVPGDTFSYNGQAKDFISNPNEVNAYLTTRNVKTIFDYLDEAGKSSAAVASIFTKGISAKPHNKKIPISVNFQTGVISNFNDLINYLDGLNNRDDLNNNDAADFVSIYLLSHDHGLNTNPNAISFSDADNKLGDIITKLSEKNMLNSSIFIITSEHGFKDVIKDNAHAIKSAMTQTNNFALKTNGETAYYYLPATQAVNQVMSDAQDIEDMESNAQSSIYNKIDSIYVKKAGMYQGFLHGLLYNANNPIKNVYSDASGDILLMAKNNYYFAQQPKESVEDSGLLSSVPLVITGKYYEALLNGTQQLTGSVSVIDLAKTIAYAVGGNGLSDSINVDGRNIFSPQLSVFIGSPVNLHLYDSFGNHVGPLPDGTIEANIPLSEFNFDNRSKHSQIDLLEAPDTYKILLDAYKEGNFTLKISKHTSNESFSIVFPSTKITKNSKATLDMANSNDLNLQFDVDGDGIFESTISADANIKIINNGENNVTVIVNAAAGKSFDINLIEQIGVRINGTALFGSGISNGRIDISRRINSSSIDAGVNTILNGGIIDISSNLGDEQNNNLRFSLRYSDTSLGFGAEKSLKVFKSNESGLIQINAVQDNLKNQFSAIEGIGTFVIAASDELPRINSVIIIPPVTTIANANITIQVNATDNSKVQSVNAKFQGSDFALAFNPADNLYEASILGPSQDGVYGFEITAEDNESNKAEADYADLTVDTKLPNVTITNPKNNQTIKENLIDVKFTVDEELANSTYVIDSAPEQFADLTGFTLNLSHGPHLLTIFAKDKAGNIGSSSAAFDIPAKNIEISNMQLPFVAKPTSEIEAQFDIRNTGNETVKVNVSQFSDNIIIDSKQYTLSAGEGIASKFDYNPALGLHNITIKAAPIVGETYLADNEVSKKIFVSNKTVALIVNDAHNLNLSAVYENSISKAGLDFLTISTDEQKVANDLIKDFRFVVWFTGSSEKTLNGAERDVLNNYLSDGGFLVLSGKNIGSDIGDKTFFIDSLRASFAQKAGTLRNIAGISNDPISRGLLVDISSGGETINPIDSFASEVFTYIGGGDAALRIDDGNSKIIYFAFGLEDIAGESDRNLIMKRTVADFKIDVDAPVLLNITPRFGSALKINITNVTLSILTDEAANCAISEKFGLRFVMMTPFDSTNSTSHAVLINNLANGMNTTRFIKCQDSKKNTLSFGYSIYVNNRTFLPPVLEQIPAQTVNENQTIIIAINATDPENDPLSFDLQDLLAINFPRAIASRFAIINNTLILQTNFEDAGNYRLNLNVNDAKSVVSTQFTLKINNVNRKPVILAIPALNAPENSYFSYNVLAFDPDSDPITYSNNASLFKINFFTGNLSFTPREKDVGTHVVNITVSDASLSESQIVNVVVTQVNDPPVIEFVSPMFASAGIPFVLKVNATDPESDALTFSDNATIFNISSQGLINFTPTKSQAGVYFIKLTASDGQLLSSKILNLIIQITNSAPIFTRIPTSIVAIQNQTVNLSVSACDIDINESCAP